MLSSNPGPLFNDIFQLRAKLISDYKFKNKILEINKKSSPYHYEKYNGNYSSIFTEKELRSLKHCDTLEKIEHKLSEEKVDVYQTLPTAETPKLILPKINKSINNVCPNTFDKIKNSNFLTESRKLQNKFNKEKIEYENAKFADRIKAVKSPFNIEMFNDEYKKNREYFKIAHKLKKKQESNLKTIKKLHLPEFVLSGLGNDIIKLLN